MSVPATATLAMRRDVAMVTEWLCQAAAGIALSGQPLADPRFDWTSRRLRLAPMLAHVHGIAPLLSAARPGAPAALIETFHRHRALSAARAERLLRLRAAFSAECLRAGAAVMALKGARLLDTLYPDPALRPMADLDFLCRVDEVDACQEAALRLGFERLSAPPRHTVYGVRGAKVIELLAEHPGNPLKIELHTRLAENFLGEEIDITPMVRSGDAATGHLAHGFAHVSHHSFSRTLRFCQIIDLALMLRGLDDGGWRRLFVGLKALGLWWAYAPLGLVAAYFPGIVTPGALEQARRAAPLFARRAVWRISDVSYSAIGDGGLRVRMRWARRPAGAVARLLGATGPVDSARRGDGAVELRPLLGDGWPGRASRLAAWLTCRGIRPVSARLIQLALNGADPHQ